MPKSPATQTNSLYDVHPGVAMVQKWIADLKPKTGRTLDTGGLAKKDRITHRIELTSTSQIDPDLKKWLRAAYDLDA
jgi:hypothetical protein